MSEEVERDDKKESEPDESWLTSKGINVFFAVIVGVAAIGFFVGTQGESYDSRLTGFVADDRPEHDEEVEEARSYSELMENSFRNNEHLEKSFEELSKQRPDLLDEVERTEEMTAQALEERQNNRAFEGAPPTVPHPIREIGAADCMACHGEGLRIDGKLATPMSHDYVTNCTQCHVPDSGSIPAADSRYDELPLDNSFAGLQRWGPADRAHPGAPPTNPHPTNMREDCMSCHGTMARPGLRTTHPWQSQCAQCHGSSATLDQQPLMDDPLWYD